jgi:hypothetical protein
MIPTRGKAVWRGLVCALLVVCAQARTFTNTGGKSLEGEVLSVSTTQAVIERSADRKRFTIPLNSLTAADQEFLMKWREENPEFKLAFDVSKQTENRKNTREGMSKTRSCDVHFRISVTNRGDSATLPATIRYRNHLKSEHTEASPPGAEKPKEDDKKPDPMKPDADAAKKEAAAKKEGSIDLPAIDPGKTVVVTTTPVQVVESSNITITKRKTDAGIIEDEHVSETKETMEGVSLVVRHQERDVATWTTPGSDDKLGIFQNSLRRAERMAREGKER